MIVHKAVSLLEQSFATTINDKLCSCTRANHLNMITDRLGLLLTK